jgi:hypothetical protein
MIRPITLGEEGCIRIFSKIAFLHVLLSIRLDTKSQNTKNVKFPINLFQECPLDWFQQSGIESVDSLSWLLGYAIKIQYFTAKGANNLSYFTVIKIHNFFFLRYLTVHPSSILTAKFKVPYISDCSCYTTDN